MIYNVFSNFGNIVSIVFVKEKAAALLEYENQDFASIAKEYLNNIVFLGTPLRVYKIIVSRFLYKLRSSILVIQSLILKPSSTKATLGRKFSLETQTILDSKRTSPFLLTLPHQFCTFLTLLRMFVLKKFSNITLAHLEELRQLSKRFLLMYFLRKLLDLCQLKTEIHVYLRCLQLRKAYLPWLTYMIWTLQEGKL